MTDKMREKFEKWKKETASKMSGGYDAFDAWQAATAQSEQDMEALRRKIAAWESRFPGYCYRQQDDCVSLK